MSVPLPMKILSNANTFLYNTWLRFIMQGAKTTMHTSIIYCGYVHYFTHDDRGVFRYVLSWLTYAIMPYVLHCGMRVIKS
jgi:hypothetical protein